MELSRRTFLEGAAAVPLAGRAGCGIRIVVVGAGAFGVWTALHLQRRGARVTLVDAWGAGNPRSSSGGETRVIRAIYGPDRIYVEMVRRAYELWEQLDPALYVETGTLWMLRGDDAYVRTSIPLLTELGFAVDRLEPAEARRRYPQIAFDGVRSVWLERRAGVLSARQACGTVLDASGASLRIGHAKPGDISSEALTAVLLDDGQRLEADAYVFACGPWLRTIFPDVIGESLRPTRQEVFYFGTPQGSERYKPSRFPVWIDFGERIFYGIPDVHGKGFKIADDTRGERFDPTNGDRVPSAQGVARARDLLAHRFPELAGAPLLSAEVCQYENSPDGHLIIDRHPHAKNVWIAGGGSGHGFKLSPAVGEMVAEAVLEGTELPAIFRIERLREAARATQFERK